MKTDNLTIVSKYVLCAIAAAAFLVPATSAYDEPAVNLGFTSFVDGGPPAGPGWYLSQYVLYWDAGKLADPGGEDLALPVFDDPAGPPTGFETDSDLGAMISLTQILYQSKGKWGLNLMVPTVSLDLETGTSDLLQDNGSGMGDLLVGPYIQWAPKMGKRGPLFMHRVEFSFILPTGKNDNAHEVNPGANHFSFNPYWAATAFFTPRWTGSWRLNYLYNGKNDDPSLRVYGDADEVRPGDAIFLNFASAYEVVPKKLRVGINGYYFNQMQDTEVDGVAVPDSREKVLAVGPGAVIHFSKHNHLFLNMYAETSARNRPQGSRFLMRWVHHFK